MNKDLFGNEYSEDDLIKKSLNGKYNIFRQINNYRLGDNEKKCKNCDHAMKFDYHDKIYYKCELQGHSHSKNSDIRLKNVCDLWGPECSD